jgi:hypothetical protein
MFSAKQARAIGNAFNHAKIDAIVTDQADYDEILKIIEERIKEACAKGEYTGYNVDDHFDDKRFCKYDSVIQRDLGNLGYKVEYDRSYRRISW